MWMHDERHNLFYSWLANHIRRHLVRVDCDSYVGLSVFSHRKADILSYTYYDIEDPNCNLCSNISAISWRPVLVVEEAGEPRETHRPSESNW
jgi:hypothetical protein